MKESPYFRARFEGQWKDSSTTQPIALPNAKEAAFKDFVTWLYFRQEPYIIQNKVRNETCVSCNGRCGGKEADRGDAAVSGIDELTEDEDVQVEQLLEGHLNSSGPTALYLFADQFDVPSLREQVINWRWRDVYGNTKMPRYAAIVLTLRHLPPSSPYRRLVTDECWQGRKLPTNKPVKVCPFVRLLQLKAPSGLWLALANRAHTRPTKRYVGPLCQYHEHGQDKEVKSSCMSLMNAEAQSMRRYNPDWDMLEKTRKRKRGENSESEASESDDSNSFGPET